MGKVYLYFGNRQVGVLALEQAECAGIGAVLFARGIDDCARGRSFTASDGAEFLDAVVRELSGAYLRAELRNA